MRRLKIPFQPSAPLPGTSFITVYNDIIDGIWIIKYIPQKVNGTDRWAGREDLGENGIFPHGKNRAGVGNGDVG